MSIRSTAKAIIINDNKLLLNKCRDEYNGEYYSLPGGGQNKFETMTEAVIRECLEETGYTVKPLRFAALCEEICEDADFRQHRPEYAHKMYHIFVCEAVGEKVCIPTETDELQIGMEWLDIGTLEGIKLLPKLVGENLRRVLDSDTPIFLGSEHIKHNHG
ncbi:MAG: NUDIX domain-containing protein [Clostridia bacterium]|nr:NUDIX domain-containing protein [Clostridia bacterium]